MAFTPVMYVQEMQLACQSLVGKESVPKGYRNKMHLDWGGLASHGPASICWAHGLSPWQCPRNRFHGARGGYWVGRGVCRAGRRLWLPLLSFYWGGADHCSPESRALLRLQQFFLTTPTVSVSEAGAEALLNSGIFDLLCSIKWWCEACFSLN